MNKFNKFILLILIATVCRFSVVAQTTNSTPEATIKNFYAWYVREIVKNKFPLTEQPAKMKQLITIRCYNENKRAYDKNEFDADYFIAAQDYDEKWATNVKVSNVKIVGNKATANVILDGKGDFDSKLKLKLIKEKGTWKIDVIEGQ
jgi:Protein of unknown function (DUF3828)